MKKVSRAKASDALGKMMGKAIAARAAGAVPMGAPATPPMGMKKGGSAKKMASGGSFRSSANGIAVRGKTKGKQVTMKNGGKC